VRDQRGFALSSPLTLVSVAAVVVAAGVLVTTGHDEPPAQEARTVVATRTPSPSTTPSATTTPTVAASPTAKPKPKPTKKPVRRAGTYVEVYNNSGIPGLAGKTSARAQGAGWEVVGSDNWYGTIPASTVYYPQRLEAQAVLLGKDLGIRRVKPVIAPMRGDRLTVILTRDYS